MKTTKTMQGKLFVALLTLLFSVSAASAAGGWDAELYRQIESRIVAPTFKDKAYNVKKFGASPKNSAAKKWSL